MNYDPNLCLGGRMTKQVVKLTFQQFLFKKDVTVEVTGNCVGMAVIDAAVSNAFDDLDGAQGAGPARIVLEKIESEKSKSTLECEDDDLQGEEWLKDMLVAAEIISIEPYKEGL